MHLFYNLLIDNIFAQEKHGIVSSGTFEVVGSSSRSAVFSV